MPSGHSNSITPNITPGYEFVDGESVTAAKLNQALAGQADARLITGLSLDTEPPAATSQLLECRGADGLMKVSSLTLVKAMTLSGQSKLVPVGGDRLSLSDSEDGSTLKPITVGSLVFGAVETTAPEAADLVPLYDVSGAAIATVKLATLISGHPAVASAAGSLTGAETVAVLVGGALKQMTLGQLVSALSSATPAATDKLLAWNGSALKSQSWADLFGVTEDTDPTGTALVVVKDGDELKVVSLTNVARLAPGPGVFRSDAFAIPTASGAVVLGGVEHHRDGVPDVVHAKLMCIAGTATHGYAVGDEVNPGVLIGYYLQPSPLFALTADSERVYASVYWYGSETSRGLLKKDGSGYVSPVTPTNVSEWFKFTFTALKFS